jgi:hypothetical protein
VLLLLRVIRCVPSSLITVLSRARYQTSRHSPSRPGNRHRLPTFAFFSLLRITKIY